MSERILTYEQALDEVLTHARRTGALAREEEYVLLSDALGRTLASEVRANRDQPPFHRSTRDGFAVRSTDPGWVTGEFGIVGSVRAGERWAGLPLADGQVIEIMTGAPLPNGADAVLMLEHATREGNTLKPEPQRALQAGENVVQRGAEAIAGNVVLPAGRLLGPAEVGVAASVGKNHVSVTPKPKVAIIATGDELVELPAAHRDDHSVEEWQIYNSNTHTLAALVSATGALPLPLPIARDTMDDLRDRIDRGRNADLLLLSGGVSRGKYDLVEDALAEHGAEFIFTGALIQPGKPVVFGKLPARTHPQFGTPQPERYFFGLPGNPISTQVCFHLFVAPMIRALAGRIDPAPQFAEARLAAPVKGGAKVTRFLPAELRSSWQSAAVDVIGWQGSGDLTANARGNCYAVLPAGMETFEQGQTIRVLLR